mgnify:FL=1|tara:strand:+ start:259 stop:642 length:384 start_codon:yes stop_codon:yes gene_type:complete
MAIINFLSNIRNAAIANAVIVAFHIYIAFAAEGVDFLIIVLLIGALIAAAYFIKGEIGAGLLAAPTIIYIFIFANNAPDMFESLKNGGDENIGWGLYILIPFWLFTILLNIMSIVAELRRASKHADS